jgi:hypothetical protein
LAVAGWTAAAAAGVLWPGRALGLLDGLPLNGAAEALLVGLAVPALWFLDRSVFATRWARVVIVALLVVKAGGMVLTPQGLCARFSTASPLAGEILTIPVEEPAGLLRSWDVRADWRASSPACTAIVDRPYASAAEFPAWFVNVLDFIRPGRTDLTLDLSGYLRATDAGLFSLAAGQDMTLSGTIGREAVSAVGGRTIEASLEPGVHPIALHATLTGDRWSLMPRWNGGDAWRALSFTTAAPRSVDAIAPAMSLMATALTLTFVAGWVLSVYRALRPGWPLMAWMAAATLVLVALGAGPRYARLAGLVLCGGVLVPLPTRHRNTRGAFLLLGVPWLAFFAARGFSEIGRFTAYSADDWLAYQVAGYRIFMHGYWLEAGSKAFDYQPLYRWISGALHLVFGDSSIGETYLDAACLLAGGLLAFHLAKAASGHRAAMLAAGSTLATFTLGTIWYFVGRGLSEVAAAGCSFLAVSYLLRARLGRMSAAAAAGVFAVLMVYTRLNLLIFAACLPVLLLPIRTRAALSDVLRGMRAIRVGAAAIYAGVFATGVLLFMARTWWYSGVFSLFYGTSLKNNDTGLRASTLGSAEVWGRVSHSLSALVWMNEPPHADPRAAIVLVGAITSVLAVLQVPALRELPASLVIVTLAAMASALFVHTHNYPGRMSIHLVPFTSAATVLAGCAVGGTVLSRLRRRAPAPGTGSRR